MSTAYTSINFNRESQVKKITLAALVFGAFGATAHAQSSVTIYGMVDAGIVSEHGGKAGAVEKITSGVGGQSRLGFKGVEDLGNGLSTIFVLESGFKIDDGTQDTSGSLFNRQALVGLSSKELGAVTLGRQNTPWYNTLTSVADPFGANYAGSAKNLLPAGGSNTRTSNTLQYSTPVVSGFSGDAAYSAGEQAGDNKAGRQWGADAQFKQGPLTVRAAYSVRNSDVAATGVGHGNGKNTLIAANYDFQVVKAFLAYGADKGFNSAPLPTTAAFAPAATAAVGSTDSRDLLVGATAPIGVNGTLLASYIKKDDRMTLNQDADQYAIGYSYALSKRTSAYVMYAHIRNKNGAGYTVGNNNETGSGNTAYNIGLHHVF